LDPILPMIIPGQFGFNCPSGFREEAFWNIFPIGSNVKLSPAVAAILNFISEQKIFRFAIAGHRLTLDPMGKCSNAFFSETTNIIKAKLYRNVHWMVLYNLKIFCSDMKTTDDGRQVMAIVKGPGELIISHDNLGNNITWQSRK
jgi:hypothetical protein